MQQLCPFGAPSPEVANPHLTQTTFLVFVCGLDNSYHLPLLTAAITFHYRLNYLLLFTVLLFFLYYY